MQSGGFGRITLSLLIVLASVQLLPHLISTYGFLTAMRPLYISALVARSHDSVLCNDLNADTFSRLTDQQRISVGSVLISLTCTDMAVRILPEMTTTKNRSALLAYQLGLIAWAKGDTRRAAVLWSQGEGIDQRLLIQARDLRATDLGEAQRWYEAAIMAGSSQQTLAESITAYSEELRGRVSLAIFSERLTYLESYFDADTAIGCRLCGQRSMLRGDYSAAFECISRAIALGVTDAETWYLLGDAAWKVDDLLTAEQAYRAALDAQIQISWRKSWHLHRLATLLVSEGRLSEALPFQEEAVRLSDYYSYSDSLAVLLAKLGEKNKALSLCRRARMLASSTQPPLQCEKP